MRPPGSHFVQAFDDMVGKDGKLHPVDDFVDIELFELNNGV
jgi:hypothetical protein